MIRRGRRRRIDPIVTSLVAVMMSLMTIRFSFGATTHGTRGQLIHQLPHRPNCETSPSPIAITSPHSDQSNSRKRQVAKFHLSPFLPFSEITRLWPGRDPRSGMITDIDTSLLIPTFVQITQHSPATHFLQMSILVQPEHTARHSLSLSLRLLFTDVHRPRCEPKILSSRTLSLHPCLDGLASCGYPADEYSDDGPGWFGRLGCCCCCCRPSPVVLVRLLRREGPTVRILLYVG
jgi:hypothetical protein